ncbi:helix-turn-helix domain-containing protein [Serratia ficaria]|uniref:helix-turn-helix domain-containing protein n=1 Tax=Serratia ficaria TaxID=61651 RepID=UPI0021C7F35B|nr:helix-turn-helix transcriptional regulator [Serratia ficaria]
MKVLIQKESKSRFLLSFARVRWHLQNSVLNPFKTGGWMKKKERSEKESEVSFEGHRKESMAPRLLALMNGRTIREVSKAWGVSASNINNYLYRGSIPRTNILQRIADAEGITISELLNQSENSLLEDSASNPPMTADDASHRSITSPHATNAIKERVQTLIGERSRRTAAKAWGMSISTLTNFLERGTVPTYEFLNRIAGCEGVDIEWLITGDESLEVVAHPYEDNKLLGKSGHEDLVSDLFSSFDALSAQELNDLRWLFKRKGIEIVLQLLDEHNQKFFALTESEKHDRLRGKMIGDLKGDDVFTLIDAMPIRDTAKQIFKLVLNGNDSLDREILLNFEEDKNFSQPDHQSVNQVAKKA